MAGDAKLPEIQDDGMRYWAVAGAAVRVGSDVLIVLNQRKNGTTDWSTPGGVIDDGEGSHDALAREVKEETGLTVDGWSDTLYTVRVIAPDLGFTLDVEAFEAVSFSGELVLDDPDGIVIDAEFVSPRTAVDRMADAPIWVAEPFGAYLIDDVKDGRHFRYHVTGRSRTERVVERVV